MRRSPSVLIFALILVAGCSDPASDPFKVGAKAKIFDPEGLEVALLVIQKRDDGKNEIHSLWLPTGTQVVVVDDTPAKPPVRTDLRLVKVRIGKGPTQGLEGNLNRHELRAAR